MTTEWSPVILVVDDEPANVRLLERLLAASGYPDVRSTGNPREVESIYIDAAPDLVMLDLHMPGLDGYEVMKRLSQLIHPQDYLPILMLTADVSPQSKQRALEGGAKDFLAKPFDTTEALARVANLLETRRLHLQMRRHADVLEATVEERTADLRRTIDQLERVQEDLRLAQEETITSLSFAAEFRDRETSRHIERMSRYCYVLAEGMGIDPHQRETVRVAAKMHDVGKIGIPDAILLKPGPLGPNEFEIMKKHADIGHDILSGSSSQLARTAAAIAWTHHEKVDGSGYPRGLTLESIPLEGRIAAVADVFDALTSDRVYREAFDVPQALDILREGRATHFDAAILDLFFLSLDEILETKKALDETGG